MVEQRVEVASSRGEPVEKYRADIDGLRAVAVLSVIFYHAGLPWMPGGYVGVDIFFVISGFLISRLIFAAIDGGGFSFRQFYIRRVRRLLPAYVVVVAACILAGLVFSFPRELVDLGQSLVASSVFSTNVLFWQETGYFAGQAEIKPLLHTWSLSVEEQFYLVFPLFFLLLRKASAQTRIAIVGVLAGASLAISEWMVSAWQSAAFYLLPARAWELLLGTLVALVLPFVRMTRHAAAAAGLLGLLLAIVPAAVMSSASRFPGLGALLPCLGAAMLILAGASSNPAGMFLSSSPMVFVGKISYSLYLWHWPIFAFLHYTNIDEPPLHARLAALLASVVLATLSWRFVERPFRDGRATPHFRPFAATAVTCVLVAAIGAYFVHQQGLRGRFSGEVIALLDQGQLNRTPGCMAGIDAWKAPEDACVFPAGASSGPTIALWGDSHAQSLVEELGRAAGEHGTSVRFFGYSACPPVPGLARGGNASRSECTRWNSAVLERIVADPAITDVVLAARHAAYLKGFTGGYGPAENHGGLEYSFVADGGGIERPSHDGYFSRFEQLVVRLVSSGKRVVILQPVPEIGYDVPLVLAMRARRGLPPESFDRPRSMYQARQGDIRASIEGIAQRTGATLVDPEPLFCDERACRVAAAGASLYADDDHLSDAGVRVLLPEFQDRLFRVERGG